MVEREIIQNGNEASGTGYVRNEVNEEKAEMGVSEEES